MVNQSNVKITIFDLLGNIVKTIINLSQPSGENFLIWDTKSDRGQQVSAGVYFYSIEVDNFKQTKKMILLK